MLQLKFQIIFRKEVKPNNVLENSAEARLVGQMTRKKKKKELLMNINDKRNYLKITQTAHVNQAVQIQKEVCLDRGIRSFYT